MHRAAPSSRLVVSTFTVAMAVTTSLFAATTPARSTQLDAAPAPPVRPAAATGAARQRERWTSSAPAATALDAAGDGIQRDLRSAGIRQQGQDLVVSWRTQAPIAAGAISTQRPLCIRIGWDDVWRRQACIVSERDASPGRVSTLAGGVDAINRLPNAHVWRSSDRRSVFLQLPLESLAAPLRTWRVSWSARGATTDGCTVAIGCVDTVPSDAERASFRSRLAERSGCTARSPWGVRRDTNSAGPRRIALTFDDGPGPATGQMLRELNRLDVTATFFVLGVQVRAEPDVARRILAQGHELGSHSWRHRLLPSRSDQRATLAYITQVTGYRPCIFRPPYGAISRAELDSAQALRTNTINWDVDPADWRGGSSASIAANVISHAHAGSIVLMHDGGGGGRRTVGAIDSIVHTLRGRGYELVTVSELLGLQPRWRYRL